MWEAELAIRHHGCPVSDVSKNYAGVRIQNVSKVRLANGCAKRLLRLAGDSADIQSFVADFRGHERTRSIGRVSGAEADGPAYFTCEIEYDESNPSILQVIDQTGCYQHSDVVVTHGIEHWGVYTVSKAAVRSLIQSLEESNNNVELDRSVDVGPITDEKTIRSATLRSELTEKQSAAFEAALALDYYDDDGDTTMKDIADHLDLHRSTVGEHLKKAQNTLLTQVGNQLFPEQTQAL